MSSQTLHTGTDTHSGSTTGTPTTPKRYRNRRLPAAGTVGRYTALAVAAEVVGAAVHDSDEAGDALRRAYQHDPSPAVRKKASWYVPGGPIHRRTAPRHDVTSSKAQSSAQATAPSSQRTA